MIDRRLERDDAAPVVTDEKRGLEPDRVEEGNGVVGEDVACDSNAGLVGQPVAACVRCVDVVVGAEHVELMAPHVRVLRKPVQEYDRRSPRRARVAIVHPQAGRVDEMGGGHRAGMYFAKST